MITHSPTADLWLFGYGSLIWKADFEYAERLPASLPGWERRFWQGSHDHRGTPENPGRVVTLIRAPEANCVGMGYRIDAKKAPAVLAHLDFREKNGYERFESEIHFHSVPHKPLQPAQHGQTTPSDRQSVSALVYIATPDNFAHLGDATDQQIAEQIHESVGPSGTNREYLLALHDALQELGAEDDHVARLVDLVLQIG